VVEGRRGGRQEEIHKAERPAAGKKRDTQQVFTLLPLPLLSVVVVDVGALCQEMRSGR